MQTYTLPRSVLERLAIRLKPYRNRDACLLLATFLGRFHAAPRKLSELFPVDRRALTGHAGLGLSERQVRSALKVLLAVCFLDAIDIRGSAYRLTEEGLRRKPRTYRFAPEFFALFDAVNKRPRKVQDGRRPVLRSPVPASTQRPSMVNFSRCPKETDSPGKGLPMGQVARPIGIPPKPFVPDANLEAALERLKQGFRASRGSGEGGAR